MNLLCDHLTVGIPRLTTTSGESHWVISHSPEVNLFRFNGDYLRDGYYKTGVAWDHSYYYQLNFEKILLEVNTFDFQLAEAKVYFEGYIKEVTITGLGPTKELAGYVHIFDDEAAQVFMEDRSYDIDLK